ncbi:hypothetical protein CYMTET_3201 [Cymbomonas tetramitiformis]|uniref:Uncharacterized protein n=1 Tax=Cymbomonas tetramitiformis TaxID=36881 RepID=A0AAE0H3S3_9CHLO|nr:hypothetical protein CYMTET_3201 [Cymbomonas tetramitiformis]|eukprot:gene4150-5129_t
MAARAFGIDSQSYEARSTTQQDEVKGMLHEYRREAADAAAVNEDTSASGSPDSEIRGMELRQTIAAKAALLMGQAAAAPYLYTDSTQQRWCRRKQWRNPFQARALSLTVACDFYCVNNCKV